MQNIISQIHDIYTGIELETERSFLRTLYDSYLTPIAALAKVNKSGNICLEAMVSSPDGLNVFRSKMFAGQDLSKNLGINLAKYFIKLLSKKTLISWNKNI